MSVRSMKGAGNLASKSGSGRKNENGKESQFKTCNDLDEILDIVGGEGRYQKIFLYGILSPITAIEPLLGINLLFMLYEPNHWCKVPGREESGLSVDAWKNLTIPREDDGEYSKCQMFDANRTKVACAAGWEYDLSDYDHTIPSDFDWVCDKAQWATWVLTANALGNALGTIILGQAADKLGRKPVFITTIVLNIFGRIASLYVVDTFWMFLSFAVITGLGFPMIYIAPAMIGAELSGRAMRSRIYGFTWIIWVVGMASLPWMAYLARDWYTIGLITTVPCALVFILCIWIPESPRWLLSMGKVDKTAEIIKSIAKSNGTEDKLSDTELYSMLKQIVIKQDQGDQSMSVFKLFSKFRLARNTTLIIISWILNSVTYYIITLNASNLSGDQFLNFFILAMIEVPAGIFGSLLGEKFGRRWTQVIFFALCAVASVFAGIGTDNTLDANWKAFSVVAAVIAKFSITLTFLIVYLQATEIFPTRLRSTGSGFASTWGSIMGILSPSIVYTSKFLQGAPWFIIGGMSIIGVVSSAYLPETLNQRLPETLEEADNFGKGNKFWSLRPPSSDLPETISPQSNAQKA